MLFRGGIHDNHFPLRTRLNIHHGSILLFCDASIIHRSEKSEASSRCVSFNDQRGSGSVIQVS